MSRTLLVPVGRPAIAPRPISARLRSQLVYFTIPAGSPGIPALAEGEFWFDPAEISRWLDDGVINLISPLDTAKMTEVELDEEQESLMTWLVKENIQHVRVEER